MPHRWAFLYIKALSGNLEGVRLSGLLREMNSMSDYLFESEGYSGFISERGFGLTHTNISGFLLFGPRR
jgi:hypothetical protein